MKEFRSSNFTLNLYADNSALYLALKNRLESFTKKKDIQILKDLFRIFTRENLTTDYLSLKLVEDNIPSLLFAVSPYRNIAKEFIKKSPASELMISDLACVLLIEDILFKEKKVIVNKKVLRQLAGDIFQFWKESLVSYSVKDEKIPSNIKDEYDSVIRKFIKRKGNKKIEFEFLFDACVGGKSFFISEEEAKEKFGEEIFFYGVSEMDPLHFKILEILSEYVKVNFFIPAPRLNLMNKNSDKLKDDKLNILLSEWNILRKFFGDKKKSEVESILDFSFLGLPTDAKMQFYESQETYREIEFVGREILRLVEENKHEENFRLTSIKLILPSGDLNYSLLVTNIFERMGIPFSLTKDIRKKKSPYFSAVVSILKLAISDFDKESVFSLFYNPCFYPKLEETRLNIKPEIWNQIISKMNLAGFLDKLHKKNLGLRESNLMTWESLWSRLNLILIGDDSQNSIVLDSELLEEAYQLIEVSSSLLQDLIGLKEDFHSLSDFSKFFRIVLDTYLHTSMRYSKSEDTERLNERGQTKIYNLLASIESIDSELKLIIGDKIHFSLEDFADILLSLMDAWTGGDSKVLKSGVVVGELMDAIDPSFDFVFLIGMDARRFSNYSGRYESVLVDDSIQSSRKDSALKQKNYFYHIFNHSAKKYMFSYVSLDTIKDREYYPATELEWIRSLCKPEDSKYNKIPLFSYLEYKMSSESSFEKETFNLISLKKKESNLNLLKDSFPDWEDNNNLSLMKEIDSLDLDTKLNRKMKSYFFRTFIDKEHSDEIQKKELSVHKFVNYLECPKKFFFNYSLNTEEESEVMGEIDSIDSLKRHLFIKETINSLVKTNTIDAIELTKKIFLPKRIQEGEIPYGVLGKIAEMAFIEYLNSNFLPFYKKALSSRFAIRSNAIFNSNASKTSESTIFSSLTLWDNEIRANVDLLLVEGDNLYLTLITTSKKISDKTRLNAGLTSHIINQSTKVKEELANFLGLEKIQIRPAILHFPLNGNPNLLTGELIEYSDEVFKPFWNSLYDNQFPAFPMKANDTICQYCPVNTVCHGYQAGFHPFLEAEMNEILKLSQEQFEPSKSASEKVSVGHKKIKK